jgi:uncharacterized peroxidase-related enzyme
LPVQPDAANDKVRNLYSALESELGFVPNFIKTWAHSDNFVESVATLYGTVMGETGLSEKIRSLVILRTCQVNKCAYTAVPALKRAREAGWTAEQMEAIDQAAESNLFVYYEKEAIRLAELTSLSPDDVQEEFWMQLDNHYTSDQVVEMITLIGFFNMINRLALVLEVAADPEPAAAGVGAS